jgi:ribonuclease HI
MLMNDHIFFAYLLTLRKDFGTINITSKHTMQEAYALLINNDYQISWARFDLMNKLGRLRIEVYDTNNPDSEVNDTPQGYFHETTEAQFYDKVDTLTHNFSNLPAKLPNHIRWHQCKLTFHANYFARRLRHLDHEGTGPKPHLKADQLCFLCNDGPDYFRHVHLACQVVTRAENFLLMKHGFELYHKNLNTLLLTDKNLPKKTLLFRTLFNFTVYRVRCQVEEQGNTSTSPKHIITSFENTATAVSPSLIGLSAKRQPSFSQFKVNAIASVTKLIADIDNFTILAYTDGSASPNPGNAGAGIHIVYRQHTYSTYVSLGDATNNIGEVYAIGMICDAIKDMWRELGLSTAKRLIILSDSLYAIGALANGWKTKTNYTLIQVVKTKLKRVSIPLRFFYCPGHCGIEGNEIADYQAGLGTIDSAKGLGTTLSQRLSYYTNNFCYPTNTLGIQHCCNMHPD